VPRLWVKHKSLQFLRKERRPLEKMKKAILEALEKKYEAQIAEADATIKIYLENSVGIGEHPQHIHEVDKQIQIIAAAEENLKILKEFE
jgi:hypothetical protein